MHDVDTQFERLTAHKSAIGSVSIRDHFMGDDKRFERFSLQLDTLLFDFSKNRIDDRTLDLLVDLAAAAGVERRRDDMFAGKPINETENRAVLHVALRGESSQKFSVDGQDVVTGIHHELERMRNFSDGIRSGQLRGFTGRNFTDVVNIGVGGSDLGPAVATAALRPFHDGPRTHFVSNMDGSDVADTLRDLDPETTLFLAASKSFTTDETMTNAETAKAWLVAALGKDAVPSHFVALSTNLAAVEEFGIRPDYTFGFWDWVGGRYSLWSAIGLPICLAVGFRNFTDFLAGGRHADHHFRDTPLRQNIPVVMALLGIWYRNIWDFPTHAVIPYDQRLARLPAYLQQLDMESNGKRVTLSGHPVNRKSGPIVWGEAGTNGQHAFFQLIHQGTDIIPVDFLIAAQCHEDDSLHHAKLVANCFAQSEALMLGKNEEEVRRELRASDLPGPRIEELLPHKIMPGNRPSNTFLYDKLDPRTLGMLIALYEHKVFVQGTVWGVNSFDQWGVEFGKKLANELLPMIEQRIAPSGRDTSTLGLIRTFLNKGR